MRHFATSFCWGAKMRNLIVLLFLFAGFMPGLSPPAAAADRTIVILDASGSMWGQIGGKAKIEIARETLATVLKTVPADTELGLMVYGHREKGSCSDIELAVPPKKGSASEILAFAKKISPKGKTPLSEAVKEAAEALKYTEEKATVVLVTDGLETCEADPCALASELKQKGVDFTAHVVGFGLTKDEGRQVACLAENTGGKYFDAANAAELASALAETFVAKPKEEPKPAAPPEPEKPKFNVMTDAVLSQGGPSLGDNSRVHWDFFKAGADGKPAGDPVLDGYGAAHGFNLDPGRYVGVATLARLKASVAFDVTATEIAKPAVNFDAAILTLVPKRTPDGEPDPNAHVWASFNGGDDGGYGPTEIFVPAGDVPVTGDIGSVTVTETIKVAAGQTLKHDLVIGTGVIVAKAVYGEGGPAVEGGEIRFDVVDTKKDINGNRKDYGGTYGVDQRIDVPTGDVVLIAKLGSATGETPFSVKAGEMKEVTVNINAGVLAVTAPGAYRVDIRSAKKDIQGKQKDISGGYDPNYQDTVPPGDYIVHVTYEGDKAAVDKPATVKSGERTEVTVE